MQPTYVADTKLTTTVDLTLKHTTGDKILAYTSTDGTNTLFYLGDVGRQIKYLAGRAGIKQILPKMTEAPKRLIDSTDW